MPFQGIPIRYPIPPNVLNFALKAIPFMIGYFSWYMRISDYYLSRSSSRPSTNTFDFIVVGGGSAGSVIIDRLSENPNVRVLLLEAGGEPNPYSYFPIATPQLQHTDLEWNYYTVPQNECAYGLQNQEVHWPRGKSLGGSSSLNYMIYMKGNPRDYDRWAEVSGDNRWSYENVDKYFHKMEDYSGFWKESGYHGKGGPLHVEEARYTPGLGVLLDAAKEAGFEVRDLNHDQQPGLFYNSRPTGFSGLDFTKKRGIRYSTYRAYIRPSLHRKNLVVYRYSLATKIHFDENLRAVGVSFLRHGKLEFAKATNEIIISAGAINSPQLLMLSGIGQAEHLSHHKILPIADLPVGENLQDHVVTLLGPFLFNETASFQPYRDLDFNAIYDFAIRGRGPITTLFGFMATGLAATSLAPSPHWPDVQFTIASQGIFQGFGESIVKMFNMKDKIKTYLAEDIGTDAHFVATAVALPKSRGNIRLKNSDPLTAPLIDPKYYSDPENHDLRTMLEGINIIMKIYENTTSFKRINSHFSNKIFPGCESIPFRSQQYFTCLIKTFPSTNYHPVGTCAMGKVGDPRTVVDSELRVVGVKSLRVCDASIMPFVTNANTNAPSILIGEICSDRIKADWKLGHAARKGSEYFRIINSLHFGNKLNLRWLIHRRGNIKNTWKRPCEFNTSPNQLLF